ncbi:MAG TPA: LEA type 2 family protein [Casimicrobiaceae bacterium]|nr:LEA type 2 family protein [Casimicrobiaceae bacterium]
MTPISLWTSSSLRTAVTIAALALAFSALAACASLGTRLAAPKVTVESISVGGIQGADAVVTLSLRVENPNAIELLVQSLQFGLSINDIALTRGATTQGETIAAGGYSVIRLETRTNMKAVLQVIALSASGRLPSLQYALDGEAIVQNGIRLPFARRGDIPLPVAPAPATSR